MQLTPHVLSARVLVQFAAHALSLSLSLSVSRATCCALPHNLLRVFFRALCSTCTLVHLALQLRSTCAPSERGDLVHLALHDISSNVAA